MTGFSTLPPSGLPGTGLPATGLRAEEQIRFAVGSTALGAVLIAVTERGLRAVSLDDTAEALESALHQRFPWRRCTATSCCWNQHSAR